MLETQRVLRYIVLGGVFLLAAVTPFLVADSLFFPFITGKNVFFRSIVGLVFGAWAILALIAPMYRPRLGWVVGSFLLFVAVMVAANFTGVDPSQSFWSNFERMEGYVTLLFLAGLLVSAAGVLKDEKTWWLLFHMSLAASTILALVAIAESLGGETSRVSSTMGNPIYLAGYMLFNIFFASMYLFRSLDLRVGRVTVYGLIIVLQTWALLATGTRGSILGLVAGVFVVAVITAIFERGRRWLRWSALVGVIGAVVLGLFLGFVMYINNSEQAQENEALVSFSDSVSEIYGIGRFTQVSLTEGNTGTRITLWGIGLDGFQERPILGWGQENYGYVFNERYEPELHNRETWYDRAHNMALEWLIAGGILGFVTYMAIFGAAIVLLWRSRERFGLYDKAVLSAVLLSYFVHNFFVFDNIVSSMLFVLTVGYIAVIAEGAREVEGERRWAVTSSGVATGAGVIIVVVMSFAVYAAAMQPMNAAGLLIQGMTGLQCSDSLRQLDWESNPQVAFRQVQNSPCRTFAPRPEPGAEYSTEEVAAFALERAAETFDRAFEESRGRVGMQEVAENAAVESQRVIRNEELGEAREVVFETVHGNMLEMIEQYPNKTRPYITLGALYENIGEYERAIESYETALERSPDKQYTLQHLAGAYIDSGNIEQGLETAERMYELHEPPFTDLAIDYAIALLFAGEDERAEEVLTEVPERSWIMDEEILNPLGEREEYQRMIEIRERRIEILTGDMEAILPENQGGDEWNRLASRITQEYVFIAQTYATMGDMETAIATVDRVTERFPSLADQAEQFKEQLRSRGSVQ